MNNKLNERFLPMKKIFRRIFAKKREMKYAQGELERALEERAQQSRAINPETKRLWEFLQRKLNALNSEGNFAKDQLFPPILKPAIIFATTILVLSLIGGIWFNSFSVKTYETARSQRSTLLLKEGTEVILNHTSELIVERSPFEKTRRVKLNGEAFFNVQKKGEPFLVITDVGKVQVKGTSFNVRMRDNRLEVAVVTGSVQVKSIDGSLEHSVILSAGQITQFAKGGLPEPPITFSTNRYPGWLDGNFIFYKTPLSSVCKELESYFDTIIKVENSKNITITGIIDGRTLETTLNTLTQLTGKRMRHENSAYIIY